MKQLFIFLLILFSLPVFSQPEEQKENTFESRLSISPQFSNMYKKFTVDIGINYELVYKRTIGFNWRFSSGLGMNPSVDNYHINGGLMLGLYFWKSMFVNDNTEKHDESNQDNSLEDIAYKFIGGTLLFLLPEGVNFYIPLNQKSELIPYINPAGYEFFNNKESVSFEMGLKLSTQLYDNIVLTPSFGYKFLYSENIKGFTAGIGIGLIFK
jgi:hypothetical protein